MHRPTIGLIALVLLVAGVATYQQSDTTLPAACLRMGLVMGIWWFAFPQLASLPRWLVFTTLGVLVVGAVRPRLLWVALPVIVLLWFLSPRRRVSRGSQAADRQAN